MEMELHTANSALFSGEEEEEEEGFQEAVPSGLSLLRPNEALTPDPVTLQSVRLAAPSQDRTGQQGSAGFGNICRF